jgi:Carboxypeptidase regulatory-like domain
MGKSFEPYRRMKRTNSVLLAALLYSAGSIAGQEAAPPAPRTPPANGPSAPDAGSSSSKTKSRVVPSFLIVGTVFNENALSFPGVQVRVRVSGEKKFRWDTYTNSRGEFAVRVPPGSEYEVVTHVKKYNDQTQNVNAKADVQQRLSIKLEPLVQAKTGAKE